MEYFLNICTPQTATVKGVCSKLYWEFDSKSQRIWHTFIKMWQHVNFSKSVFSPVFQQFRRTPLQTIEASHFPWEKSGEFPSCLGILENQRNVKKMQWFVSSKVYQHFWNSNTSNCFKTRVYLLEPPHQQLKSKSRFWSFSTIKYFKLNWCNIECLGAIDIKSDEVKNLDLKYNQFVSSWYASNSLQFLK